MIAKHYLWAKLEKKKNLRMVIVSCYTQLMLHTTT